MADQKLSALAVAVLTDAAEMYLNASGSRKATLENLRNFFLGAAIREAVVAASTGNGALATDFENGDTLDGVTLVTGDRFLLKDQTAGEENGPYTVEVSGAPTRATDFDVDAEAIRGASFLVIGGTANANTIWMHTTTGAITLDTTPLVFTQTGGSGGSTWLGLSDTDPSTFSGQAAKHVAVNTGEDGLEFVDAAAGGLVAGATFKGALVLITAVQSITNVSTPFAYAAADIIDWDGETYDIGGWHDNSTNNSRMTVPNGVTKVTLTAGVNWAADATGVRGIRFLKNGVVFAGDGEDMGAGITGATQNSRFLVSPVVQCVAGDYFEVQVRQASGGALNIENSDHTYFSIQAVEAVALAATPRGALVKLAADEETANYSTSTAIPFDAEEYDTDDIHDNVTNKTRLTVPAGVTHVRLTGFIWAALATPAEFNTLNLRKNGSEDFIGYAATRTEHGATSYFLNVVSPIIQVVAGDYFELFFTTEVDTSITVDAGRTSFAMEIVEPAIIAQAAATGQPFKGALVILTADETLTTTVPIPWDAEIYDIGDFWSSGADTRLTIPAGVTKVRVKAAVAQTTTGADQQWLILKNGVRVEGGLWFRDDDVATASAVGQSMSTAVLEVVEGDYFELSPAFSSGTPNLRQDLAGGTWFSIEAIQTIAPHQTPRGALVHKVADETADYSTQLAIPWDIEAYDTDAIHDNSVNPSRLTVPAGVTKVQLQGSILVTGATAAEHANLTITKNGVSTAIGLPSTNADATDTSFTMNVSSPPIPVVAGDYFELELEIETDASITLDDDRSWFSMELIEAVLVPGGAGKQTLWIPVTAMTPTVTNGAGAVVSVETVAGQPDQHVMPFVVGSDKHAQFEIGFPKAWDKGTLSFEAFWTHQGGQTGGLDGVAWALQGVFLASGDPFATAYGTAVVVTDDQVTGDDIYVTAESAAMTLAGTLADGGLSVFRLFRDDDDAANDLDIDAQLVGIHLFFTTDKATDD